VVETISYWQEGVGYGYSIHDNQGLPFSGHLAVLQVETIGNAGTLLTYRQYFYPEDSIKGSIVVHASRWVLNMALGNLADKFGDDVL